MKKEIIKYTEEIEKKKNLTKEEKENFLENIKFFQHERLIHLLVTMFVALFGIISLFTFITLNNIYIGILFLLFLILLIPYVLYYYFIENAVQKLYKIYNEKK